MWNARTDCWEAVNDYLHMLAAAISTGWPELDRATGGLRRPSLTYVVGPRALRRALLTRVSAWSAGAGWSTAHLDDHRGSMALASEIIRAGAAKSLHGDGRTVAQLPLVCLGAEDLERALQLAGAIRPLDVFVVDGFQVSDDELMRLAHRQGTAVLVGVDHKVPVAGEAGCWVLDRSRTGSGDANIRMELQPSHGDERYVDLCLTPSNHTPDLITRAGYTNVFARRQRSSRGRATNLLARTEAAR